MSNWKMRARWNRVGNAVAKRIHLHSRWVKLLRLSGERSRAMKSVIAFWWADQALQHAVVRPTSQRILTLKDAELYILYRKPSIVIVSWKTNFLKSWTSPQSSSQQPTFAGKTITCTPSLKPTDTGAHPKPFHLSLPALAYHQRDFLAHTVLRASLSTDRFNTEFSDAG